MRWRNLFCLLLSAMVLPIISCRHESTDLSSFQEICFETEVLPIFKTNCAISGCHDGSGESFRLQDYSGIMQGITPYKPRESSIYKAITAEWLNLMPPDNPLSQEQRTTIRLWIEQGALNSTCSSSTDTTTNIVVIPSDSICFNTHIEPLLLSSCGISGCHDATTAKEGYVLTSYETLMRRGIVPGDPQNSKVYRVMTQNSEERMPPPPRSLTSDQIESFRKWIEQGAVNSQCEQTACDTSSVTWSGSVQPLISNYCLNCHNSASAGGGITLTSYSDVSNVANSGKLTGALRGKPGYVKMPQGFDLTECQIRTVEIWVSDGAPNN